MFFVNASVIIANIVIVLLWQVCYYYWCTQGSTSIELGEFFLIIWSLYLIMDLVSLVTLCYALFSIRKTLKLREEQSLNKCMVWSLIIVYSVYIGHQIALFVILGVV